MREWCILCKSGERRKTRIKDEGEGVYLEARVMPFVLFFVLLFLA